ncbi:DUF421 domain-containing protein [Aureimonas sp. AU40]|uniref:DUF421 domain-containing protein n=1 Tax=Aureimonas sp. AU40 TaxID=1637747 RepID=UPI0007811BFA|nr:YetF domain-containing protein [Aureimonas sp. AU40]
MFFESWSGLLRVLVIGPLAYGALVVMLRVSGKRTLAKLNAFDLVVTVALGSTLATVLLSKSVALAEGVTALVVLAGLQWVVAWLSVRSDRFGDFVRSEPTLLLRDGRFLDGALRSQRVRRDEVLAALRSSGVASPEGAAAVILETDGSISVIEAGGNDSMASLGDLEASAP